MPFPNGVRPFGRRPRFSRDAFSVCGVAGFWWGGEEAASAAGIAQRMADAIRHRGPDDGGAWTDPQGGIALGHRRLAVIDPSPLGRQPMVSGSGRFVITYNGEIYNYREVSAELERAGMRPRSHCDTEVLLEAIDRWGLDAALARCAGMYAFALWDVADRSLHLVRDRVGQKPLYYGWAGDSFLFASELKALRVHPCWRGDINRDAVAVYLRHGYVPAPHSIYRGIRKVRPGSIVTLRDGPTGRPVEERRYWVAADAARNGAADPIAGSEGEIAERFEAALRATVGQEMISDVPLGAFLSGGVDSSLIVALMQSQSGTPVRTFSIGFHEPRFNEADYAKAVAGHLGTDHTELYVTPADALNVVPRLPELYDEPFADSSQIPTFLLAELTRRSVTVSLSGDGGDELFGGYERYQWADRARRWRRWMPGPVRRAAAVAVSVGSGLGRVGEKGRRIGRLLGSSNDLDMYRELVSVWHDPARLVIGGNEPPTAITDGRLSREHSFIERLMRIDLSTYLPDDIMVKVDRATMGVSLEARAPYLDHRIVELSWRLPLEFKVRAGRGKWIARHLLHRYLPLRLIERPKRGFSVPLDEWLRGPLREWSGDLLGGRRVREDGFLNAAALSDAWRVHQDGGADLGYRLWALVMFEAWRQS